MKDRGEVAKYYAGVGYQRVSPTMPPKQEPPKQPVYKKWWFWVIIVVVALGVIGNMTGDDVAQAGDQEQVKVLSFLDDFSKYGYSQEQIANMKTILTNVGITEITDLDIGNVVSGMQVIKGVIYKDPVYQYTGKEVHVQFNIENGKIYLVSIYCPSYSTSNQPTYLSGLNNRRADLYYDVEGGYLKKIDWEKKAVIDY